MHDINMQIGLHGQSKIGDCIVEKEDDPSYSLIQPWSFHGTKKNSKAFVEYRVGRTALLYVENKSSYNFNSV